MLIIQIILLLLSISIYVVVSLSVMKVAQKLNVNKPYLAFIPIAGTYLLGKCSYLEDSDEILTKGWLFEILAFIFMMACIGLIPRGPQGPSSLKNIAIVMIILFVISLIFNFITAIFNAFYTYNISKMFGCPALILALLSFFVCGKLIYIYLGFFAKREIEESPSFL